MGPPIRFILNDASIETYLPPGTVVLDFLRRDRRLTGTKEGCREGDCGACTVLVGEMRGRKKPIVEYKAVNSCLLPLGDLEGKHLVSIEGLNPVRQSEDSPLSPPLTPVQSQLVEHGAIQCGFCTPGFVVSLTAYLLSRLPWNYEEAVDAVAGNICRCTGYASIKRAIADLLDQLAGAAGSGSRGIGAETFGEQLGRLVASRVVPEYFLAIPERLRSLPERLRSLPERRAVRDPADRSLVAGGTDLFVQKADELIQEDLSFLSAVSDLRQVRRENDRLYLGAGIAMEEVATIPEVSSRFPRLVEALPLIASVPIRNRATLGGNIINASPIADFTVMLLALGAFLGLRNGKSIRELPLSAFFKGYKQLDMKSGERLEWIALPLEPGLFSFEKVSRRRHLDIASVNSAARIVLREGRMEKVRLAAGGVAPVPLYLARVSTWLEGHEFSDQRLEQALELVQEEISPISDVRGSEQYKRLLVRQLLLAHFHKLLPDQVHAEVWV